MHLLSPFSLNLPLYEHKKRPSYVLPFAEAVGDNFVLMDDNARPHRARVVNDYLEDEGSNVWTSHHAHLTSTLLSMHVTLFREEYMHVCHNHKQPGSLQMLL